MVHARRRPASALLAVVLSLCALGAGACADDAPAVPGAGGRGLARVVRVVDGDTIVVRLDGAAADERVRLIGIDTPESVDPRTPVECFGREASERAGQLLPPGTRVRLERDVEARDRYDRLLAYVHRADDGLFVNLAMVEEGYAAVATYPPNTAHTADFTAAAAGARGAGRGLWRACDGSG